MQSRRQMTKTYCEVYLVVCRLAYARWRLCWTCWWGGDRGGRGWTRCRPASCPPPCLAQRSLAAPASCLQREKYTYSHYKLAHVRAEDDPSGSNDVMATNSNLFRCGRVKIYRGLAKLRFQQIFSKNNPNPALKFRFSVQNCNQSFVIFNKGNFQKISPMIKYKTPLSRENLFTFICAH